MALKVAYDGVVMGNSSLNEFRHLYFSSLWWKDICGLGGWSGFPVRLVHRCSYKDHVEWSLVLFWYDVCFGHLPLKGVFPRLFSISNHKEGKVIDTGED